MPLPTSTNPFDNLHSEVAFQMARQRSAKCDGCQFTGISNHLRVWHHGEDMLYKEQRRSRAPRGTRWLWVSVHTFGSWRCFSRRSHVQIKSILLRHIQIESKSVLEKKSGSQTWNLFMGSKLSCWFFLDWLAVRTELLTPLCPPGLGRCSRRRCRCLQPELAPSPECCSRRSSGTRRSGGSAASPPLLAPAAPERSLLGETITKTRTWEAAQTVIKLNLPRKCINCLPKFVCLLPKYPMNYWLFFDETCKKWSMTLGLCNINKKIIMSCGI